MPKYIAVIADVIGSRQLAGGKRVKLQEELRATIRWANERFKNEIAARLIITTGDEFQGLLRKAECLPDLLWEIGMRTTTAKLRFGIGKGELSLPIQEDAIDIDGPALHRAREAITVARRRKYSGPVMKGFGEEADEVLTGVSQLIFLAQSRWKPQTKKIIEALRATESPGDAAANAGKALHQVSHTKRRQGYDSYELGELAWRQLLKSTDSEKWPHANT